MTRYLVVLRVAVDSFDSAQKVADKAQAIQPNPVAPGAVTVVSIRPEEHPRYCARCSQALSKGDP